MPVINLDFGAEATESKPLPEAEYLFTVDKVKVHTKNEGEDSTQSLIINFKVTEGELEGKSISRFFSLAAGTPRRILAESLEKITGNAFSEDAMEIDLDDLPGYQVIGGVVVEPHWITERAEKGELVNRIKYFRTAEL